MKPRMKTQSRRPQHSDSKPSQPGYWVKSASALRDYLRFRPEGIAEIRAKTRHDAEIRAEVKALGLNIPISLADAAEDEWFQDSPLAFRAIVEPKTEEDLWARLAENSPRSVLALDHIQDPRNLGAIIRSAAFFGIQDVLVPSRRQVLITESAVATAQGGFALVHLYVMTNLTRSLEAMKKRGYWILGADAAGTPVSAKTFAFDRMVLVLGSEQKGLAPLVTRSCDMLVAIPRSEQGFDSLNVSVACGIMLHEMVKPVTEGKIAAES